VEEHISPAKPRREHNRLQDWVTSFDRDLIRASRDKIPISFFTLDEEVEIVAARVIQVDKEFIKVRVEGEDAWFNKSHICSLRIASAS